MSDDDWNRWSIFIIKELERLNTHLEKEEDSLNKLQKNIAVMNNEINNIKDQIDNTKKDIKMLENKLINLPKDVIEHDDVKKFKFKVEYTNLPPWLKKLSWLLAAGLGWLFSMIYKTGLI